MVTDTETETKPESARVYNIILANGEQLLIRADRMENAPDVLTFYRDGEEAAMVFTARVAAVVSF